MPSTSPNARFIRARISFDVDKLYHNAGLHPVTNTGVMAFRWTHFDPRTVIGKNTLLLVEVPSQTQPYQFKCEARFTCEETAKSRNLGLEFELDDTDRVTLETIIAKEGEEIVHTRKYPRIPYLDKIQNMPHTIIMSSPLSGIRFQINNLSPAGMQIVSEDGGCGKLMPGDFVHLALEPRDGKSPKVNTTGQIRQISHRLNPATKKIEREIGVEFAGMPAPEIQKYSELLRKVLLELKSMG